LKTNIVILFSPNTIENKGGYAPIWPHINAAAIKTATKTPDFGPSGVVAPPIHEGCRRLVRHIYHRGTEAQSTRGASLGSETP
jgi:hypothetical protein